MPRPTLKNLCGIDLSTLEHYTYSDALLVTIDALKTRKKELAEQLRIGYLDNNQSYENTAGTSNMIKYIEDAIEWRESEYMELIG